jgi:hypothetical protein
MSSCQGDVFAIRGLAVMGNGIGAGGAGVRVFAGAGPAMDYCAMAYCGYGVSADVNAGVMLTNCAVVRCGIGVQARNGSTIFLTGDNYIYDNILIGIQALWKSQVAINPWSVMPTQHYTTDISTHEPTGAYSAIHAEGQSLIRVIDVDPNPLAERVAAVRILNPGLFKNDQYFGVSLESGSMFIGAQRVSFSMPINDQWTLTVPMARQFVTDDSQTSAVIR